MGINKTDYEFVDTILYVRKEGTENTELFINKKDRSMWTTQMIIAELFNVNKSRVSRHLKKIFDDEELDENLVVINFAATASMEKIIIVKI